MNTPRFDPLMDYQTLVRCNKCKEAHKLGEPHNCSDYHRGLYDALSAIIEAAEKARQSVCIEEAIYDYDAKYKDVIDSDLFIAALRERLKGGE